MQSDLFHCKVILHISGVTAPIIRSTKNCNRSLRCRGHNIGTATSLQRGQIGTGLCESHKQVNTKQKPLSAYE